MKYHEQIIKLLNDSYSLNEIKEILNISYEKLSKYLLELKNKGFIFNPIYYSDGQIIYTPVKSLEKTNDSPTPIYTSPSETELTIIAISDLHLGNKLANIKALNTIYDYCIQNNIHIILNTGDLIDAITFGHQELKQYKSYYEQYDSCIKKYPQDSSITNFTILGNHDVDALLHTGQSLERYLKNYRPDIVPLGFDNADLLLKKSKILLKHPIKNSKEITERPYDEYAFILKGHRHHMVIKDNGVVVINVPSLSDLKFNDNFLPPEALKININFHNGSINRIAISQLIVTNKVCPANTININIKEGHHTQDESLYEQTYKKRILKNT